VRSAVQKNDLSIPPPARSAVPKNDLSISSPVRSAVPKNDSSVPPPRSAVPNVAAIVHTGPDDRTNANYVGSNEVMIFSYLDMNEPEVVLIKAGAKIVEIIISAIAICIIAALLLALLSPGSEQILFEYLREVKDYVGELADRIFTR
jgi:hypothetical protein